MSRDVPVLFAHIPKAAGSSLGALIQEAFSADDICPYVDVAGWSTEILRIGDRYKFYRGHFSLALRSVLGEVDVITFVRDPIQRSISHFHQLRRDRAHKFHEYASNVSFSSFIRSDVGSIELLNMQCRQLAVSSLGQEEFIISNREIVGGDVNRYISLWDSDYIFEKAMDTVNSCAVVSAIEDLDVCYKLIQNYLGFPSTMKLYMDYNSTADSEKSGVEICSDDYEILANLTRKDKLLYDNARSIGLKAAASIVGSGDDQCGNRIPEVNFEKPFYSFSERLNGTGWYPREPSRYGGYARWSSRSTSDLYLRLPRTRLVRVQFALRAYVSNIIDDLRFFVDEQEVVLLRNRIPGAEGHLTFAEALVPASEATNDSQHVTKFGFEVPFLVCPNVHTSGASSDVRNLGIYLNGLRCSFA